MCMPAQMFARMAQNKTKEKKTQKKKTIESRKKVGEVEHDFSSAMYSFIRPSYTCKGTCHKQIKSNR